MKDVVMVVDLQFGSTGKGQIAGTLGRLWGADTVVCANGPNAGHTYRWTDSSPRSATRVGAEVLSVIRTVMPVGSVLPTVRNILIGPGAVIDLQKLREEVMGSFGTLGGKRLVIHPNATIVLPRHVEAEKPLVDIGSTMKGTAEAVVEKMRRRPDAPVAKFWAHEVIEVVGPVAASAGLDLVISYRGYDEALDASRKLLVEGAQGHSLSMHSRFYPHCTSRDVSINQLWADCHLPGRTGASGWAQNSFVQIVGVCRTYPIRVANRYGQYGQGGLIGSSGGHYDDQKELQWLDIGRDPELTTVTRLPRRLFSFSTQQILEAVRYNAPTSIALTFCDYLPSHNEAHPGIPEGMAAYPVGPGERISPCVESLIHRIQAAAGRNVDFLSFGPNDTDVYSVAAPDRPRRLSVSLHLPWEY